ncbi:MYND-type domain-containing protein [Mycena sanguinolenta]|uniref:MYND-type domain-containing protein n=1 Tax=Mycena sanguinolenta TaxID=230812 RepID=A0A8H6YSI3_9AGAR|nr:MYND-type domain-containing protein [Mycena sanguinolenta]
MVLEAATNREEKLLPLFYHHLDPTKIPSGDAMDTEILATDTIDTIMRALMCMEGLYNSTPFPEGSHPDLWERVWPWAQFLDVHHSRIAGGPTEDMLRVIVLGVVVGFDGIFDKMTSTPEIGVLAAQVWGSSFRNPTPISDKALYGVAIFLTWGNECGLDPFIVGAGSVDALAILVVKLVDYILESDTTPETMMGTLRGVIMFSKCSEDDAWLSALRARKFMAAMISVLLFAERHIEALTDPQLCQILCQQAWEGFFRLSTLNPSYTGVVEVVDAGLLQLISLLISRNLDWTEQIAQGMIKFIVQPATVYYPVLAAIEHALPSLQQFISASVFYSSAAFPDWREFFSIALDRLDIKRKFDLGEYIACKGCDNLECGQILKKTDFKRCAGCKHTHYCSKECQINDWRTGHRASCTRRPESPAHLTNRDTAFLRFLVAHDYERHKQSIFLARILQIHLYGEKLVTFFDYDTGGVQIDVRPLSIGNGDSNYYLRVRRSGRRIHPVLVQVTTGQAYLQQWFLSIRSSASEVHDTLFQSSQTIPPGTDSVSQLSPAIHQTVAELIETMCPQMQEIVVG